jgi:hypothetical protein
MKKKINFNEKKNNFNYSPSESRSVEICFVSTMDNDGVIVIEDFVEIV